MSIPSPRPMRTQTQTQTQTQGSSPTARGTSAAISELVSEIRTLTPGTLTAKKARQVHRRAKQLGRCDLVPSWVTACYQQRNQQRIKSVTAAAATRQPTQTQGVERSEYELVLMAKCTEHDIPLPVLRTVFKRGLSEYACVSETSDVPAGAVEFAHARVNTFVRLVYGDCEVREDDVDLLQKLERFAEENDR